MPFDIKLVFHFAEEQFHYVGAYGRLYLLLAFICNSGVRHPSSRIAAKYGQGQMWGLKEFSETIQILTLNVYNLIFIVNMPFGIFFFPTWIFYVLGYAVR